MKARHAHRNTFAGNFCTARYIQRLAIGVTTTQIVVAGTLDSPQGASLQCLVAGVARVFRLKEIVE